MADSVIGLIWKHGFRPKLEVAQGLKVSTPFVKVAQQLSHEEIWTNPRKCSLAIVYVSKPRAERLAKGTKGKVTNTEIPKKLLQLDAYNKPMKTKDGRFVLKKKINGRDSITTAEWYRQKHSHSFKNNVYTTMPIKFLWEALHLDYVHVDEMIQKKINSLNVKYNSILQTRKKAQEEDAGDLGRYQAIESDLRDQMLPLRDDIVAMLKTRQRAEGLIYLYNFHVIQQPAHDTLKLGGPQNVTVTLECKLHLNERPKGSLPSITATLDWVEQGVGGTVVAQGTFEFLQGRFSASRSKGEIWDVAKLLHPIINNPPDGDWGKPALSTAAWKAEIEKSTAWKYLEDFGKVDGDIHHLSDRDDPIYKRAGAGAAAPTGRSQPRKKTGSSQPRKTQPKVTSLPPRAGDSSVPPYARNTGGRAPAPETFSSARKKAPKKDASGKTTTTAPRKRAGRSSANPPAPSPKVTVRSAPIAPKVKVRVTQPADETRPEDGVTSQPGADEKL